MQQFKSNVSVLVISAMLFLAIGCDRTSSPEGRMSIRIENLQREMIDSLKQQNRAILDSLSAIRAEINELKQDRQ